MLLLILIICGVIAALGAIFVLLLQQYRVRKGVITLNGEYNGPADVSFTLHLVVRYFLKRSVYARKFIMQYILHIVVRFMYYLDKGSSYIYSKSRNWFVKNAVKNRGTVPHFWEHLKVYKQEMDKEKVEEK
ncbi:MAG: hypothetical protein JWN37_928 [Candidatus Nomurabacteria bacterium]|nr:hypothetical protein [Candidatus Nomurabacteria bacterium]